jgi:hypothetical protein
MALGISVEDYLGIGFDTIHKFGRHDAVGSTYVPVAFGGLWQTPQVAGATTLRIKAGGDAADDAGGVGAREILLQGIDEAGNEIFETLATNGISASASTSQTFLRLYRLYVSKSGTYGTALGGSHVGDIVIEDSAGSADWATIDSTNFANGQSEIAAYTVPNGKVAYMTNTVVGVDKTKFADVLVVSRKNILESAAPYSPVRTQHEIKGIEGVVAIDDHRTPDGPFDAGTDIIFLARAATGSPSLTISFEIIRIPA